MATNIIYKGELNGTQVDFSTGSLTDISTFDTDVRSSAIQNSISSSETTIGASQAAIYSMSGQLAASAHPAVTAAGDTGLNLSNGNVIQDLSLGFDDLGHVESATFSSVNLDSRYYTETEVDAKFTALSGDVTSNDTDISDLRTDLDTVSGLTVTNANDITALEGATGTLNTDIGIIETATGNLNTRLTSAESEIDTLQANSGNYLSWGIDEVLSVDNTTTKNLTVGDLTGDSLRIEGDGSSATISGPATITLDPDSAGVGGKVVIAGDLQVDGTTTTINSTSVQIDDLNLVLGTGAPDNSSADGGGIIIDGTGDTTIAEFTYDGTNDRWTTNSLAIAADIVGNADTATAWANARTITVNGDAAGSVTIDGTSAETLTLALATNSVAANEIVNGSVGSDELGTDSVITAKIEDGAVTNAKLANSSVSITGGAGLAGGGSATLGGSAVELSISAGHGLTANTDSLDINLDGSTLSKSADGLKVGTITSAEIAGDAIDGTKIADDAIDSEHVKDGSIDNVHLAGSIAITKLAAYTFNVGAGSGLLNGGSANIGGTSTLDINVDNSTLTIASDAVKVKDGGIDTTQLAGEAVTLAKMAANSVDSDQYVDGSIDNVHLAGSIANDKLTNSSITITASNGLSGGGTPALGGSTSLSTSSDQGHLDEIELGSDNSAETNVVTKGGILILRGTDNDGISTSGADGNAIDLNDKTTVAFEGIVQSARTDQDSDNGSYVAMWKIQGVIRRDADSTNMLQSFVTKTFAGSNASSYGISVSVNGNGLKINSDQTAANLITSATINYNWIEDAS